MEVRAPKPRPPAVAADPAGAAAASLSTGAAAIAGEAQGQGDAPAIIVDATDSDVEEVPRPTVPRAGPAVGAQPAPPKPQTLRISAGRAAAAAGIHPFADIGELFLELLYQDMPELLLRDAALAGVEVVSPVAERARLLAKSGEGPSVEKILASAKEAQGIEGARAAQAAVRVVMQAAQQAGRLTAEEAEELRSTLDLEINLEFGARHEDAALDAYEKRIGRPVYGQQKRISISLPGGTPQEALEQVFPAPRGVCLSSLEGESAGAGSVGGSTSGSKAAEAENSSKPTAYFRLTGFVDALVDLPRGLHEPGAPGEQTAVVEVKHRMGKIKDPPEIYDIVQLGSYCRALGCTRGALVQCLREGATAESVGTLHVTPLDFTVGSRDRRGWDEHVLPGLYGMAHAVYRARADTELRLRLLATADSRERAELVRELCPHLG